MARVNIEVVSQKGVCQAGHEPGQKFVFEGLTPPNFCASAFVTLYPSLRALQYGANFPYADEGEVLACCADPENPVVFKLKRLPG